MWVCVVQQSKAVCGCFHERLTLLAGCVVARVRLGLCGLCYCFVFSVDPHPMHHALTLQATVCFRKNDCRT
jgi:hypothetical protein